MKVPFDYTAKGGERLSQKPYSLSARARAQKISIPDLIEAALDETGSVNKAARLLGIHHSTLIYHMGQHGISLRHCVVKESEPTA